MNQAFMKEKKVLPLVISMSFPMVLSMAVNALYNIVDSYFVAKISEKALTSLSLIFPLQNLVSAVAVGFAIGINACVAYQLGAKRECGADRAASQGMALSLLHGILLAVLCIAGTPVFLSLFSDDREMMEYALVYADRVFLFSPVIALGMSFEKIFQAVGKMKLTMFCMMCGLVTNLILDPLMIFGIGFFPKMEIAGAAYATGIGQVVSLAVYLVLYAKKKMQVQLKWSELKPDKNIIKSMYSVGASAALNLALPSMLISVLNGILAPFGEAYVLMLGVYYKLQTFIYMTANGIIQGIRPLMGYNYGAGERKRVREIFRTTLILILAVMVIGTIVSWTVPEQLVGLFTSNGETIRIGVRALRIISLGFIVSGVSVTCCGALEGLGKGLPSLLISLARYTVIILPAAFILSRFLGADGVWVSFVVSEFVSAVFAGALYKSVLKE